MGERGSVVVVGVRGAAEGGHGLMGHGSIREAAADRKWGRPTFRGKCPGSVSGVVRKRE